MRRLFLAVLLLLVIAAGIWVLMLGAFPPAPRQQTIQKVLPNDRLGRGG